MSKVEYRLEQIAKRFKDGKKVSINDLTEAFNVTSRTVKSDIAKLRKRGMDIEFKDGGYIYKNDKQFNSIKKITKKDIRNGAILQVIGGYVGMLERRQIVEKVLQSMSDEDKVSYKTIERAIKELENNGIVYVDKNKKYNIAVDTEIIYEISKKEAHKFFHYQRVYGKDFPFNKSLESISSKIKYYVYNSREEKKNLLENKLINIGRNFHREDKYMKVFSKIEKFNYSKNRLKIEFETNKCVKKITEVDVVTFLYVWDKDKFYVVGKSGEYIILINVEKVLAVESLDIENIFFMNKNILKKVDSMVSAALDGPYKVKVRFQNIYNIKDKLNRLQKNRKNSVITDCGDFIIYEDEIYGLYDFANYLRRFGKSAEVIEPVELRNLMKETYEKIIQAYEE
ncbi:HTH domain-containing protein [Clostridium ganghwense]|uniref:HTH domain-containing protein n=2 Tax=Clostridium ganghwense TaxID=312089 RepID=A0ABT4CKD7_9CLOT|nr:HTH domain-containing protein [Clostridium ganghwense]